MKPIINQQILYRYTISSSSSQIIALKENLTAKNCVRKAEVGYSAHCAVRIRTQVGNYVPGISNIYYS